MKRRSVFASASVAMPPAGRKTCLQVAFLIGLPVKSAFALLSQKVTKAVPVGTKDTDKKGMRGGFYWRERLAE